VVAARERSLESLRATLDSTKHFLEERLAQANHNLANKETEVSSSLSVHATTCITPILSKLQGMHRPGLDTMAGPPWL